MKKTIVVLVAGLVLLACRSGGYKKNSSHPDVDDAQIARGDSLAQKYCASCHQLPEPGLLDAGTWENNVLPQMGPRLGIFQYMNKRYPNNIGDPHVGREFYPAVPMLEEKDWKAIIDYYISCAPDSLPAQQRGQALQPDTADFQLEAVAGSFPTPPATCFIRWEPGLRRVFTSDVLGHTLDIWERAGAHGNGADAGNKEVGGTGGEKGWQRVDSLLIGGSVVDWVADSNGYVICNMGPFGPNNAPAGHIDRLAFPPRVQVSGRPLPILYDSLQRPVGMAVADLNGDGRKDLVACAFGYIKGELAWMENKGDGSYQKHVLRGVTGAMRVVVQDYNHDGLPDLWVLFAQGDEGIVLYTNKGKGKFEERQLLRFPPSYGSSYFELADFDKDGNPDILYTCGDNADFSMELKPYHGVYIFMNDGGLNFTSKYFYPINGAYRAMARDFDGDGQLDIAAISWFADYKRQPEEGFVYLKNTEPLQFRPYTVPGTECGRWITMDVADVDGDGKPDILLANCSVGPGFIASARDWKKGPPFILLRNRGR